MKPLSDLGSALASSVPLFKFQFQNFRFLKESFPASVVQAEASMNAVALKKFVEENQKLATECSNLLASCDKWERECSLYDHDREALMDFANEADERAKEAEARNLDLEEEKRLLEKEVEFYKCRSQQLVTIISCWSSYLKFFCCLLLFCFSRCGH